MRGCIIRLAVIAACLFITAVMVSADSKRRGIDETSFMYATVSGERINIFRQSDENYLFLAGFMDEEKTVYSSEAMRLIKSAQKENGDDGIKVLKSGSVPAIFIDTNSGSLDRIYADKDYRETGKIRIYDEDGKLESSLGLEYIKGRGNYSWTNWDKKSFKIKLRKTSSILGTGEGKDYALIANASDATLLRNEIGRQLEIRVGIPFAGAGAFTDLYINGDYMGNYYLCGSIEVGAGRVDITSIDEEQNRITDRINTDALAVYETPTMKGWNLDERVPDITGGYLLEREFGDRYDLGYDDFNNGFVTDAGEHYIVVSPRYCTVSEINYISSYCQRVEDEILSGSDDFTTIDTESFARRYMVEELLKNYDGGVSSAYYFKDSDVKGGKFSAGPGWDFDMSLGNYLDWMEYYGEDATGITGLYLSEHSSIYYKELIKRESFLRLVHDSFRRDALPYMESLVKTGIDEYRVRLEKSCLMDSVRWSSMYEEKGYVCGDRAEYESLKDFIRVRISYLDNMWRD